MPYRNAVATMERTVRSLADQHIESGWQLVAVDDGSSDGSLELLKRLAPLLPTSCKLTMLSTTAANRGTAAAGNLALNHAIGRYIIRCDADDMVPAGSYRTMLLLAEKRGAEVVAGGMTTAIKQGERVRIQTDIPAGSYGNLNEMPIDTFGFSLCNKIIRRDWLSKHSIEFFPGVDRWEDLGVVARVLAFHPRISITPITVYEYHRDKRIKTLSQSGKEELLVDHLRCASMLREWFHEHGLSGEYAVFLNHLMFAAKVKYARMPHRNLRAWKQTFRSVNRHVLQLRHVPLLYRIAFMILAAIPERLLPGRDQSSAEYR